MKLFFSPCPNDTFVFHALVHGLIPGTPDFDVSFADIDITNKLAIASEGPPGPGSPDILKISYGALPWVLSNYALLPCGGALGRGCGPLVLTRPADSGINKDGSTLSLAGRRVAVPSERSTAYLLFRLWAAQNVPEGLGEIVIMPFDQIMPSVRDGSIDAGLVIHEARFTYPAYGLKQLVDLGSWWEADTGLPIPLGAIIAHRSLDLTAISRWIRASVEYAWAYPETSRDYVLQHAQEMNAAVAQAHIDLYVNEYTAELGESGFEAIAALLNRSYLEGLVPYVDPTKLR